MPRRTFNQTEDQRAALERLLDIAQSDTGQSYKVSNFLLAWWNANECGGFDLTDLWGLDRAVAEDMLTVFALLSRCANYPDTLGYGPQFAAILQTWRPELGQKA